MKENEYEKIKERHKKEFATLPLHFAFGNEQIKKKLEELKVKEDEIDKKLVGIGAGGFMLKEDYPKYKEMAERHYKEIQREIENDKDGTGFIKDMFVSELNNHEYGYTKEVNDTLEALGITYKDLNKNENLQHGLELAKQKFIQNTKETENEDLEA